MNQTLTEEATALDPGLLLVLSLLEDPAQPACWGPSATDTPSGQHPYLDGITQLSPHHPPLVPNPSRAVSDQRPRTQALGLSSQGPERETACPHTRGRPFCLPRLCHVRQPPGGCLGGGRNRAGRAVTLIPRLQPCPQTQRQKLAKPAHRASPQGGFTRSPQRSPPLASAPLARVGMEGEGSTYQGTFQAQDPSRWLSLSPPLSRGSQDQRS